MWYVSLFLQGSGRQGQWLEDSFIISDPQASWRVNDLEALQRFFCVCVFPHIFQYSHLFVEILENRMLNLKLIQMASGYPWDIEEHPEELVFFFHGFFWW